MAEPPPLYKPEAFEPKKRLTLLQHCYKEPWVPIGKLGDLCCSQNDVCPHPECCFNARCSDNGERAVRWIWGIYQWKQGYGAKHDASESCCARCNRDSDDCCSRRFIASKKELIGIEDHDLSPVMTSRQQMRVIKCFINRC